MYVCICARVRECELRTAIQRGAALRGDRRRRLRRRHRLRHLPGPDLRPHRRGERDRTGRTRWWLWPPDPDSTAIALSPFRERRVGMQGDARVIEFLNEQLTAELTAINQYFLHARCRRTGADDPGQAHPGRVDRRDAPRRGPHRPDPVPRGPAELPEAVPAAHRRDRQGDVRVRHEGRGRGGRPAAAGIEYMRSIGDVTSARIFEDILADEEHHIDYLETQLDLIEKLGEPLYLQNVTEHPESDLSWTLSRAGGRPGPRSRGRRRRRRRRGG